MRYDIVLLTSMFGMPLATAHAQTIAPAISDPAPDARYPAGLDAFVLPVRPGAMNALIYLASGSGHHPTLLLLHGFPGNEQNLDLAQAARRAGWNVLTMHYRGSWGSPGSFSFTHAAEDAHAALAYLRVPAIAEKYRIDTTRIAVAGHSMGGFMAANAAADDKAVIGLFLIDPWDLSVSAAALTKSDGPKNWHKEVADEMPPLAGTSEAALAQELVASGRRFDLGDRIAAYGERPLAIYSATRGIGAANLGYLQAATSAGKNQRVGALWNTDHSFSDMRILLSAALVAWLNEIASTSSPKSAN